MSGSGLLLCKLTPEPHSRVFSRSQQSKIKPVGKAVLKSLAAVLAASDLKSRGSGRAADQVRPRGQFNYR